MPNTLKVSTPEQEGVLQVSKSRKIPVLLSATEMERLFSALGTFCIFDVSRPLALSEAQIPHEQFLKAYREYVHGIEGGKLIDEAFLRPYFSAMFTYSSEGVYASRLVNGKFLIRPKTPAIQLKRHHFIYDESGFHSGVMGKESISWGIQFSYPHLFMDPKTKAIGKVEKNDQFPNTSLFHLLSKWIRSNTLPTPFIVSGEMARQPIRLGKEAFDWIHNHPQCIEKRLYVQS